MNHRPTCPECKSESLENAGAPLSSGGKIWFPRRCMKCGHFWSAEKPLTLTPPAPKLEAPAPKTELLAVPPASLTADSAPGADTRTSESTPPTEMILTRAEGFDPETLQPGQVVVFRRKKQEFRGLVVSMAAKSILVDVDGKPDTRIAKAELLGVVVSPSK